MSPSRLNIMIAHAARDPWALALAGSFCDLPVDLHWSRTADEALGLAARHAFHVGVVDDGMPRVGGLGLLRRMRRMGFGFPCLLVSASPTQRVLQDALELEVFTVVQAEDYRDTLLPAVRRLIQQRYHVPPAETFNNN